MFSSDNPLLLDRRERRKVEPLPPPYASVRGRVRPQTALRDFRPVQAAAPEWFVPSPPIVAASGRFDDRHLKLSTRGARVISRCQRDPTSQRKSEALQTSIDEIRYNRAPLPTMVRVMTSY
eukprot:5783138-Prymnesium_polylepis.1